MKRTGGPKRQPSKRGSANCPPQHPRGRLAKVQTWEQLAKEAKFRPARMAALCPISLRQLERYFLATFGQSPGPWAKELRCRLARRLLSHGFSSKAVAADVFFASESHFCHEFKNYFGQPPQSFGPRYGRE
jgi:transcriptional regulator GlxA family with amidase domain